MTRRRLIRIGSMIFLIVVIAYLGAGTVFYNMLTKVSAACAANFAESTPNSFSSTRVNTQPYLMNTYETVSFTSRNTTIRISGWYVSAPTDSQHAPAVIIVHGLHGCKHDVASLFPAGMLHRNGFNVLMIDLRNHGDSQIEDGRYAGGTKEYLDVLGAWDWLMADKGISAERIGLFGYSLGGGTVSIAMGEEPRIAATWEDSSYADMGVAIDAELNRYGIPIWLKYGGLQIGKLMTGNDVFERSPLQAVGKLNGRPFFIAHGELDERLSVQYAYDLAAEIRAHGQEVDPWIFKGSGHVIGMFDYPVEYENRLIDFFGKSLGLKVNL